MAKIDYNFDLGNPRPRPGAEWERKVRIALLFGIVTIITGIVIYAIIPSRKPEKTVKDPTQHPEAVTKPAQQTDPTAVAPTPETGGKDVTPAPPADPRQEIASTGGDKSESGQGAEIVKQPAGQPKKGEVVPGDLSPELDQPQRSGTRDLAGEAALTKLLDAGDYNKFFAEAARLVAATPADSEARAGLGALLAAGRKKL